MSDTTEVTWHTGTFTKINSKLVKDLNVRCETVSTRRVEENIGEKPPLLVLTMIFLDMTPKAQETKATISKWDNIKLKTVCTAKENINTMKSQPNTQGPKHIDLYECCIAFVQYFIYSALGSISTFLLLHKAKLYGVYLPHICMSQYV